MDEKVKYIFEYNHLYQLLNHLNLFGRSYLGSVLDILNEEEMAVYKRGRNHKSNTQAKNASIIDYRKATGFESLIGYLYLENKTDRLLELIKTAIDRIGVKV